MAGDTNLAPPSDLEAEKSLLGAVIAKPALLDELSERVSHTDFYAPVYGEMFRVASDMHSRGLPVDQLTLKDEMVRVGNDVRNVAQHIVDVVSTTPMVVHAERYADIVRDYSKRRYVLRMGDELRTLAHDMELDVPEIVTETVSLANGLALSQATTAVPVGTAADALMAQLRLGKQDYLTPPHMPWVHIKKGELVVIAAGTSVGKTAYSLHLAEHWAATTRVAYFEYEMDTAQLVGRLAAKHACVAIEDMDSGLDEDRLANVEYALNHIRTLNLVVEEVHCDIDGLVARIRKSAQRGAQVVFVDHLGLVKFKVPKGMGYVKAVGDQVTGRLKLLATELGIVVVLLAQLNRGAQDRGNIGEQAYPRLRDIRDSGEIEQDADKVLMLWREPTREEDITSFEMRREKLGVPTDDTYFRLIRVGVEKYRNGRLGHEWLLFDGPHMSYVPLPERHLIKDGKKEASGG